MGGFNLANLGGGMRPVGGPVSRVPGAPGFWPQQPPDRDPVGGPIQRQPGFDPGFGGYPTDPRMPPTPQPMPPIARGPGDGWPVQPGPQPMPPIARGPGDGWPPQGGPQAPYMPMQPAPWGGFGGGGGFGQGNPMMMLHQLGGFGGMRSMY